MHLDFDWTSKTKENLIRANIGMTIRSNSVQDFLNANSRRLETTRQLNQAANYLRKAD